MTTRSGIQFTADLDASDVFRTFDRIGREARGLGGRIGGIGGTVGRAGGGLGAAVGAGAGLGAGIAVVEQFFERLFELFEDTPVMEDFLTALDDIFRAAGPLVGVLLKGLTPVLKALTPVIGPLAEAFAPLVELLGTNLLAAVTLLTPLILPLAQGLGAVARAINEGVTAAIQFLVDQINRLPFVDLNIQLPQVNQGFADVATQLANVSIAAGSSGGGAAGALASMSAEQRIIADVTADADARLASYAIQMRIQRDTAERAAQATADAADDMLDFSGNAQVGSEAVRDFDRAMQDNTRSAELMAEITNRVGDAADATTYDLDILEGETGEAFAAVGEAAAAAAAAIEPVSDLDMRIAEMTMSINDATEAAELDEMAFAALPEPLQAAAKELGLFSSAVTSTADAAAEAAEAAAQAAVDARATAQEAQNAAGAARARRENEAFRRGGGGPAASARARERADDLIGRALGIHFSRSNLFDSEDNRLLAGGRRFLSALGISYAEATRFNNSGRINESGRRAGVNALVEALIMAFTRQQDATLIGRHGQITIQIDGEAVAVATTRAQSEGAG